MRPRISTRHFFWVACLLLGIYKVECTENKLCVESDGKVAVCSSCEWRYRRVLNDCHQTEHGATACGKPMRFELHGECLHPITDSKTVTSTTTMVHAPRRQYQQYHYNRPNHGLWALFALLLVPILLLACYYGYRRRNVAIPIQYGAPTGGVPIQEQTVDIPVAIAVNDTIDPNAGRAQAYAMEHLPRASSQTPMYPEFVPKTPAQSGGWK